MQDTSTQDPGHKDNYAPLVAELQPNDLIGLRWAVPSQALVNGIASAPTLLDFAQSTANGTAALNVTTSTGGVPANTSAQQLVPLQDISSTRPAAQSAGQLAKPCPRAQGASQPILQHSAVQPTHISVLTMGQIEGGDAETPLTVRSNPLSESAHTEPAQNQIVSSWQRAGEQIQDQHRFAPQPSCLLSQAPQVQQSQHQVQKVACTADQYLTSQPPPNVIAAPAMMSAPSDATKSPPPPPGWLLQDMIELARSSSVAPVHPETCTLRWRVAICFPEDHELSVARRGKTVVKKGVYDAKVIKVSTSP